MHSTDIQWSAILSWSYADNILRLKSKQSEPPINFIQCSQLHQVNIQNNQLWGKGVTPARGLTSICPPGDQLRLGARWLPAIYRQQVWSHHRLQQPLH